MPGSWYYRVAKKAADWLSVVDECKINSSTKSIVQSMKDIQLEWDEEIVSFDASSLYTNFPVDEVIHHCDDLL